MVHGTFSIASLGTVISLVTYNNDHYRTLSSQGKANLRGSVSEFWTRGSPRGNTLLSNYYDKVIVKHYFFL